MVLEGSAKPWVPPANPKKLQVREAAQDSARVARNAVEDAGDAVWGLTRGWNEQQRNFAKIVLGLIAFQIVRARV